MSVFVFVFVYWTHCLAKIPSGREINSLRDFLTAPTCSNSRPCAAGSGCGLDYSFAFFVYAKLAPREFGAPTTTHGAEAQASQAQASRARQTVLGARSPVLVCLEGVSDRRYPGDRGKVAAEIFPTLIAITQQFTAVALESSLTEA